MAELADAYDSGSYFCKEVQVQFLLPAPSLKPLFMRFWAIFYAQKKVAGA
jgi:hypothetical protein